MKTVAIFSVVAMSLMACGGDAKPASDPSSVTTTTTTTPAK
jgi:hypothetical protein